MNFRTACYRNRPWTTHFPSRYFLKTARHTFRQSGGGDFFMVCGGCRASDSLCRSYACDSVFGSFSIVIREYGFFFSYFQFSSEEQVAIAQYGWMNVSAPFVLVNLFLQLFWCEFVPIIFMGLAYQLVRADMKLAMHLH